MCSKPKMPAAPPPPPPPQEAKLPDSTELVKAARKRQNGIAGGTQLTGAAGLTGGMNTGGSTLLGG